MHIICVISLIKILIVLCAAEKIQYIKTERPMVTYYNTNYISYANLSSRRYGRGDPFYYVDFNMHTLDTISNNYTAHFYFYEFLSNRYKRGFVEMHLKFCDLIEKDMFFGKAMRQGIFSKPCPYPPGPKNLSNMTIPVTSVPKNFPFRKGRIYLNLSLTLTQEVLGSGHIDMEIQETHVKRNTRLSTYK